MSEHRDLPLVGWCPTDTEVIPFPFNRRVGRIRQVTSRMIEARTVKAEAGVWLQMTNAMASQMIRAGVSQARVDKEVSEFSDAVQREIDRHLATHRQNREGGAA